MLNRFRCLRERGWQEIDAGTYADAWHTHGGSVVTHPEVVARLSGLAGLPVRYLGWVREGRVDAALAAWGRHLALSREALKQFGRKRLFDLGNAEVILPAAPDVRAPLRHSVRYLSELQARQFSGIRRQREELMLARPPRISPASFATTSAGSGACCRRPTHWPVRFVITPQTNWRTFTGVSSSGAGDLPPPGLARLPEVFALLREFMTGFRP